MNFFITVMLIQFGQPVPKNAILAMPINSTIEDCEQQVADDMKSIGIDILRVKCEVSDVAPPVLSAAEAVVDTEELKAAAED